MYKKIFKILYHNIPKPQLLLWVSYFRTFPWFYWVTKSKFKRKGSLVMADKRSKQTNTKTDFTTVNICRYMLFRWLKVCFHEERTLIKLLLILLIAMIYSRIILYSLLRQSTGINQMQILVPYLDLRQDSNYKVYGIFILLKKT